MATLSVRGWSLSTTNPKSLILTFQHTKRKISWFSSPNKPKKLFLIPNAEKEAIFGQWSKVTNHGHLEWSYQPVSLSGKSPVSKLSNKLSWMVLACLGEPQHYGQDWYPFSLKLKITPEVKIQK